MSEPASMDGVYAPAPRYLSDACNLPRYHYSVPQTVYSTVIFMPILVESPGFSSWLRWQGISYLWVVVNYGVQVVFLAGVHDVSKRCYENRDLETCETLMPPLLAVGLFSCCIVSFTDIQETADILYLITRKVPTVERTQVMKFKRDQDDDLKVCEGGFSLRRKVIICVFILVPKVLLALALMVWGFTFLVASPGNMDVILNATALVFIVQVDESLFAFFSLPEVRCIMEAIPRFEVEDSKSFLYRPYAQLAKFVASLLLVTWAMLNLSWCGHDGDWMPFFALGE